MGPVILVFLWFLLSAPVQVLAGQNMDGESCNHPETVISSVRVFDGIATIPEATVMIRCTKIVGVFKNGDSFDIAPDAVVFDGKGRTLLPGLIDTHTHVFSRRMLERPLDFGVTTVMDMGSVNLSFAQSIKAEDLVGPAYDRADLMTAVVWATAPGSHGTQFGEVPTLLTPEDARPFVAARVEQGADYIKIIYDNFKMFDQEIPTLSYDTLAAVVDSAHALNRLAVVHSRDVEAFADVARAGADGIVHLPVDEVPDNQLINRLQEKGIFVGANLSMLQPIGASLAEDPKIGPMLSAREIENLANFRKMHREGGDQIAFDALKALHMNGVKIVAGSDTPNGGTIGGASMHLELELLVEAGLTPVEALVAATSTAADVFRLGDRGRIRQGLRADLLLVQGQPDQRIKDTRNIVAIWKAGKLHNGTGLPP
jgi:imidazolonepropionase-like amidohydrolase